MSQIVVNFDNLYILKTYPDNYFDAVVTDPPYGLGKEPNAAELMQDWIEFGYHEVKGTGFMGKEWDAFVPQPVFWKEVFRVLKHGGHVLSFFGTRTYDWGVMSMRFAGFEVRDCIQWLYGSGFPKSHNIGKAIDKMDGNDREVIEGRQSASSLGNKKTMDGGIANKNYKFTKGNSEWEGWGTALKPANEPIVLARKPLEKGLSVAENILKWGVGGINIDSSRIGFKDDADYKESTQKNQHADFGTKPMTNNNVYGDYSMVQPKNYEPTGRFPANIILTHHPECECKGTKKVKSHNPDNKCNNVGFNPSGDKLYGKGNGITNNKGYAENGEETIEDWECHSDCPIRILDEQSGVSKSGKNAVRTSDGFNENAYGKGIGVKAGQNNGEYGDKGGASRFFYVAKASKSERNKGLDGFETKQTTGGGGTYNEEAGAKYGSIKAEGKNFHPTVKPIKLMQYLVKMVTPPNGIVLDPFCGSGTTGIACKIEGFDFLGIEQDAEYFKIAKARIKNYTGDNNEYQEDTPEPETPTIINDDKSQLTLF
jgi:site-specific DNA-methyltransferase (adenine-specific)